MRRISTKSNGEQYFCSQSEVDFDTSVINHHLLRSELKSSCGQMAGDPEPFCHAWTDSEPDKERNCNGRSLAMDARIRLDSLKSGCNSPLPCCAVNNSTVSNLEHKEDLWDSEESQTKKSALDLVEILDIEDNVQDEECWLYTPQKKQPFVEKEPAFRWCRHILDNPSPEMETACRLLMNKLYQNSRYSFYRHDKVSHHAPSFSLESSKYKDSVDTSLDDSDSLAEDRPKSGQKLKVAAGNNEAATPAQSRSEEFDHNELNTFHDSITTSYKLQDITDVHIMARIQEASLRQDFVSVPTTSSLRRNPEMLSSCFNTTAEYSDEFAARNKTKEAASSSCWKPGLSSVTSSRSRCHSPTSETKQECGSPKLTRLHQQVTQFKLLKLAQNQGASPSRTTSPLRTSLRSLQAVRNSRSLDYDDHQPVGQFSYPLSGVSPARIKSSCGSAASVNSSSLSHLMKESSARITTIKKLQRSQSLSPCRIPHPAKGCLSAHGRIFASPERPITAAWGRRVHPIQR